MRMGVVDNLETMLDIHIETMVREVCFASDAKHVIAARDQLKAFILANFIPLRKVSDGQER